METNRLINDDCLIAMNDIPDGSIDTIICDLPYGTTNNRWDSILPFDELWKHYRRIVKKRGAIVLFSQQPFTAKLVASNIDMFKYEWIWEKNNATGFLNAKHAPMKKHENICVFSHTAAAPLAKTEAMMCFYPQYRKGKPYFTKCGTSGENYGKTKSTLTTNNGESYYPIDILQFDSDKEKLHPTQKPVELLRYLIRTYTNEGETVLDSCCGSGPTAIAAIREKRNWICIEKDPHYHEVAKKRIETELQQLKLF